MDVKKLAGAILDAQNIREESFDDEKAEKADKSNPFKIMSCYKKTLYEAAAEAAANAEYDLRMLRLIYILIDQDWNGSQFWAETVLKYDAEGV